MTKIFIPKDTPVRVFKKDGSSFDTTTATRTPAIADSVLVNTGSCPSIVGYPRDRVEVL